MQICIEIKSKSRINKLKLKSPKKISINFILYYFYLKRQSIKDTLIANYYLFLIYFGLRTWMVIALYGLWLIRAKLISISSCDLVHVKLISTSFLLFGYTVILLPRFAQPHILKTSSTPFLKNSVSRYFCTVASGVIRFYRFNDQDYEWFWILLWFFCDWMEVSLILLNRFHLFYPSSALFLKILYKY